jgi:hypothetical protein
MRILQRVNALKYSIVVFILGVILLAARVALGAECAEGSTCVPAQDMAVITKVLKEKQCLQANKPIFQLDPINVVTDKDGRVFVSGTPYHLRMTWCSYDVRAEGTVKAQAAIYVAPEYGFRFRPKAYLGYLPLEAIKDEKAGTGIDAGVLLDFFHWKWANVNAAVGIRSGGAGLGVDITRNFGAYLGYGITWGTWRHNPNGGLWFAF